MNTISLRYGMNSHQGDAKLSTDKENLPIKILNGEPSYINILDALNAFQLVIELKKALKKPAAASFKHVSPAGAAIYTPLTNDLTSAYFVEGLELSPLAIAYAKARGTDRMSSFGDCAAFSDTVDSTVAELLKREVSDVIVAPDYNEEALEILKTKKGGKYLIIQIDPDFSPSLNEQRTVYGMTLEQKRNDITISNAIFNKIVTKQKVIPEDVKIDLIIAFLTLKYTQSNSVCFVKSGQTIGIGAGQQSRIHCTRLAASKADNWFLRQHPIALNMKFKQDISRAEQNNAIDKWLCDELSLHEENAWRNCFEEVPIRLTHDEKREWIKRLTNVSLASDAYFPFRDNLDRASMSGVKYVVQTGGSIRDEQIVQAANEYGMVMTYSGIRLFHH